MKTKNNTGDNYVAFSLWSLILLMLAGCGSITVGAEPLPAKAADPSEVEPQEVDRGELARSKPV